MGTGRYTRVQRLCEIRAGSRFVGRYTALILATVMGRTFVVEQLIAAGAGLDLKNNDGYEPIYPSATAVRYPSRQPRFVGRDTALINAAAGGHTDITAALIFAGADVDVSNNDGYGKHRRGCMSAVARALERTSPGQGDCRGRLRSRRQVGGVRRGSA